MTIVRNNSLGRLFMSLLYLGLLFGGGAWLYYRIMHFEGVVVVGEGKAERIALRPRGAGSPFAANYRNLPFDVLPLLNPHAVRRVLDPNTHYDASELPAALNLSKIEATPIGPPEEWIELEGSGQTSRIPAVPGEKFALAGETGEVISIGPWTGLIPHPQGAPLALVKLRQPDGSWSEKRFLQRGQWLYHENHAVYFEWFPDDAAAKNALPETRPGLESARWGINDKKRVHWMNSFAQGTGVTLDDGTEVTLMGAKMDDVVPVILVQVARTNNTADRFRVLAGETRGGITFEYPAVKENIIYLHGWQQDKTLVHVMTGDADSGAALAPAITPVETGNQEEEPARTPALPGNDAIIQVLQAAARAIPVDTTGDPVYEARVRLGEQEYELREGQRVTLGDGVSALQYRRMPPPTEVRYYFNASSTTAATQETFTLHARDTFRLGAWTLRLHPGIQPAPGTAVLLAERGLGGPARYLGLALFVLGAAGWVFTRFLKPSPAPRQDETEIQDKLDALLMEEEKDKSERSLDR